MALPSSGYIFKVPTADKSIFDGESLLKLVKINSSNNNSNDKPPDGKIIVSASTPAGKKVSGTLNYDKFMQIITKNPVTAPQQFEKAVDKNVKRRTFLIPDQGGGGKLLLGKLITMPQGATNVNIKRRKAEMKAAMRAKKKQNQKRAMENKQNQKRAMEKKKTETPKPPPLPPKKLSAEVILDQLVKRAVATLRGKLSKPNYPKEYILDLSVLKNDQLFKQNTFNLFDIPKYNTFDSLLSSMFNPKLVNYEYKFQNPVGQGIVDLAVINKFNFSLKDFEAFSPGNSFHENQVAFAALTDITELRFSSFNKDTKFAFKENKEKEIINAMKEKQLSRLRERISAKLLESEVFHVKKSENPYNVLSDTIYTKKLINSVNEKGLGAFKKFFSIKSENNNEIRKKLLEIAPARIIMAEKKASGITPLGKRTRAPRKKTIKPIKQRKPRVARPRVPRVARPTRFNVKQFIQKADDHSLLKIANFLKVNTTNLDRDNQSGLEFEGNNIILKDRLNTLDDRLLMSAYDQVIKKKQNKPMSKGFRTINNNNNNNNSLNSPNFNNANLNMISLQNLTNSVSIPLPSVSSVPNLNTSQLGSIILKYSMLIAMKQRLEDKMKDTTELMEFIEPYKCITEFIASQHLDILRDDPTENYETTLGCMSEIYSMKHMFKEQKAIIRFASGVTKANIYTGDDPKSFLSQVMYLSGRQQTISKIAEQWTDQYGREKASKLRDHEAEKSRGDQNKDGTRGPAYEKTTFDILQDFLGHTRKEISVKGRRKIVVEAPPRKIRNVNKLEDNPEGHASHMMTSAYKHGYCVIPSEYEDACTEDDDRIANMELKKSFWEKRLTPFGTFDYLKLKTMDELNDKKEEQNCPMKNKCVGEYRENDSKCIDYKSESTCESDSGCKWKMSDCEKHCKRNGMRYCGGINSLVKRMLNYEIPKVKGSGGGIEVNFDKVIVDLASEAKRIKKLAVERKKGRPKPQTVENMEKNIKQLENKVNAIKNRLAKKKTTVSFLIPQDRQKLTEAEKQLNQAKATLNKKQAKPTLHKNEVDGKDPSEEGMQAHIKDMTETPVQAWGDLTAIEQAKVIKESDFDKKLKLTSNSKQQGSSTITTLAIHQKGVGAIVPVKHKGKLDNAVVVSMPGGRTEVISHNALQKAIQNNPLIAAPREFGDIILGGGGLRAITKGPKEVILENMFNVQKNKTYIDRASSSFKEIVKDINSSHVVVSERIERRKNRISEEFTRKIKLSPLRFINESINKEDEYLLKYMFKEMVYKMEATRQFIQKKLQMPSKPCEYFDVLYNHFIGFNVKHGRKVTEQCSSENIKKLYTIFKTSRNIQDVLKRMFTTDRKLREVYQYAADDYFHEGLLNVSSCASNFLLLGRSRHVAINPSVFDKIRDKKISKEIRKYNPQLSKLDSQIKDIKRQIVARKVQLEKEKNSDRIETLKKILNDAKEDLDGKNRELRVLVKKKDRYIKLKSSASKGKITHIYLGKDQKWTKNDAKNVKLKQLPNMNNTVNPNMNNTVNQEAKEPLSRTSKKGNTTFFKQSTLLANYIGYLIAPETAPKTRTKKFNINDAFNGAEELGKGAHGQTRLMRDERLVMKKFKNAKSKTFEENRHMKLWNSLSARCKQYICQPIKTNNDLITLQVYPSKEGNTVETLQSFRRKPDKKLSKPLAMMIGQRNEKTKTIHPIYSPNELIRRELIKAFKCIHGVGVAHLDIKPDNLIVVYNESNSVITKLTVKLIDFGIATMKNKPLVKLQNNNTLDTELLEMATTKANMFADAYLFRKPDDLPDLKRPKQMQKNFLPKVMKGNITERYKAEIKKNRKNAVTKIKLAIRKKKQ